MSLKHQRTLINLILVVVLVTFITVTINIPESLQTFVPKGRKCRLQEQHCDIMHPLKQCCAGTSCGIKRINNQPVNICLMCRDIGQPCGGDKGACCRGLRCQRITQLASVCNPSDYKFFSDEEEGDNISSKDNNPQTTTFQKRLNKNGQGTIRFR